MSLEIPPPFPFPELWPEMHQQALISKQRGAHFPWLTTSYGNLQPQHHSARLIQHENSVDLDNVGKDEEEIGIYGFVLTEEWKKRMQQRVKRQKNRKKPVSHKEKKSNPAQKSTIKQTPPLKQAPSLKKPGPIKSCIKRQTQCIRELEASLNAAHDAYCDAMNPTMWPATAF